MSKRTYPFEPMQLPYCYSDLEPYIDTETMCVHYDGHYKTYLDNLNKALERFPQLMHCTLEEILKQKFVLPVSSRNKIMRNAGGVYNHELYFKGMINKATQPQGQLLELINRDFGSYENFRKEFTKAGKELFGSGWVFLVKGKGGKLSLFSSKNQQVPNLNIYKPILTMDVWEHAYYLKHKNKRINYIEDWFQVINWDQVAENYNHNPLV